MQIEEDYEDLKEKVRFEEGRFMENDRKDNEIIILRRENSNLKQEIFKMKHIPLFRLRSADSEEYDEGEYDDGYDEDEDEEEEEESPSFVMSM